jgi:hypothetical protein
MLLSGCWAAQARGNGTTRHEAQAENDNQAKLQLFGHHKSLLFGDIFLVLDFYKLTQADNVALLGGSLALSR